uniref:NME/NM23 family member 8 n=1 Tax=Naja naja TaxID=35670 RepID=A0A8C6Y6Y2_NAJNA
KNLVDVYQAWCGPCKAVVNLFRRLKNEYGEDNLLHFAVAEADSVMTLLPFKDKCEPAFVFCLDGKMIDIVRGANGPLLNRKVIELIELERKIVAGDMQRPEVMLLFFFKRDFKFFKTYLSKHLHKIIHHFISSGLVAKSFYFHSPSFHISQSNILFNFEDVDDKVSPVLILNTFYIIFLFVSLKEMLQNQDLLHHCDIQDRVEETSRQLAFFFSDFSKQRNEKSVERTLALIRPSLLKERRESILNRIVENGFEIAMQKEITLSEEQAREFYRECENQDYFPYLLDQMTSGPTLALALVRENAIQKWRDLLGPKIIQEAKEQYPHSLRAEFAIHDSPINQLHGSANMNEATKELQFFFPVQNTMALIKPSAFEDKDKIINEVKDAGFLISELREAHISPEIAAQFYQDHEDKPYYNQLVDFMSKGPSMVMVLTKENAVEEWRQLMGPTDPTKAKETHPNSIRAKFATDVMQNAVHGSSNEEHAKKSINFIFGDIDLESLKYKYIYM